MKRFALALTLVAGPALAQEPPHAPTFDEVQQIDQLTRDLQNAKAKLAEKDAEVAKAHAEAARLLTSDDGKKLYDYGFRVGVAQGLARAEATAAQQDVKAILEKMQPPAKP